MTTDKFTKVEFAEGCFDEFEGTQEELAELIAHIRNLAASGTLLENSRELSDAEIEELGMTMEEKKEKRQ